VVSDRLQQQIMANAAEEVANVGLEDEPSSFGERHPDGF
jgi:hypothetical protein